MIIDNTYFRNEIYIPHAKPSAVKGVIGVSSDIDSFIDEYTHDCLLKCLGYPLFKEFSEQLDDEEENGLKPTADEKWNDLLNGKEYIGSDGVLTRWRGIRYKNSKVDEKPNMSFLANYVYFFYESNYNTARSSIGHQKGRAKNAVNVSANPKITKAWRKFFEQVQGVDHCEIIQNAHGIGIDWFGRSNDKTLYSFINDMNALDEETYPNFKPYKWTNINNFGI